MGNKKGNSRGLGVASGVGISWLVCGLGILLITQLIITQQLGEGGADIAIAVTLAIASLTGMLTASHIIGKNKIAVGLSSSGIWILTVLLLSMLTEGKSQNAARNLIAIAIGCLLGCALCLKKPSKSRKIKRHNR